MWELDAALRREFARLAVEIVADPRRRIAPHRERLKALFAAHYHATALTFGLMGREMLADGEGQKAETEPGEDVRAVARRMAELRVSPERVERLVAALLASAAIVAAIEKAIASAPGDLDRAASLALKAPPVRAALAPPVASAPEPPDNRPQPGTGAQSTGKPPPPAPPEPPRTDGAGGDGPKPPPKPPGGGRSNNIRFSERVAAYVRAYAPQRATRVAEASYRIVTDAVAEGARRSESPETVAARITKALADVSPGRARRIARTGTVGAQNAALLSLAAEDGREVRKEWVAIEDGRTRATHAAADGQVVEPGERFTVGAAKLLHPGDPNGPPGEIINCRCAMLLTTVRRRNPRHTLTATR